MKIDLEKFSIHINETERKLNASKTVAVGMSGGVDSSVAALILKAKGYQVFGVYMRNWVETDENGKCTAEQDYSDVVKVCEKLEIPYYSIDFSKQYYEKVFAQFLEDYKNGHTPNPDVFCNKEIKFDLFLKAIKKMGAQSLATGHYCRVVNDDGVYKLAKGLDPKKDQSYFLAGISEKVLSQVLFPLGEISKKDVRAIAREFDLETKDKKDSTGVCFIGERNFRKFLTQYIDSQKGNFCTLDGTVVGKHQGSCFYTLGQRKGLGLGGPGQPWFVVKKDNDKNIVYVERDPDHTELYKQSLDADSLNWISYLPEQEFRCQAKVRYRQSDQNCLVRYDSKENRVHVEFDQKQRAICPRQFVVFYQNEILLGSGIIS
ncbi:MAG: tRNA 2-thiouridine(34) synthase MnmA [Halobacteriovoraceae bacterium]|nr:tRNA 2-thiouridine(34) synthase MnmA [Halobacteriovoraceae bacterium]